MAEGKKGFLLYADMIKTVEKLPKEKAGELFMVIMQYVNDLNPEPDDILIQVAFEPIKQQLKRDLKKWDKYIKKQRVNGKKGGRPKAKETQKTQAFSEKPKKADNVNVTVNVNDNVIDINNKIINESEITNTIEFCSITLNRKYDREKISELWKAFCILHESHINKKERLKHFRNWIKTQPYGDSKDKPGTSAARMEALKNWGKIS